MKSAFLSLILLTFSLNVFAQRNPTLDDLQSIKLRSDQPQLEVDVHYPNYRLGGGTPPTRAIRDCFILDLRDSDNAITPALKMSIAQELKIQEGFSFSHPDELQELVPQFKGTNVVFHTTGRNLYVVSFFVETRDGRTFNEVVKDLAPPTHSNNVPFDVNLLYVRDCRL